MSLKIKPVNHGTTKADRNNYCGPSVISAITGMTTGEASRLIRSVSGVKSVKGSSTSQVRKSLRECNIDAQLCNFSHRMRLSRSTGPTLAGWLKQTVKERTADRVFLIVAGWHWQLVQGRRYVCGISGDVVSIKDKAVKRRSRVAEVYELTMTAAKVVTPPTAKKPKRVANPTDSYRGKAKRLSKELGIEIDVERYHYNDGTRDTQYWIGGYDDNIDFADEGVIEGHCNYDWQEVFYSLGAIQEYRKNQAA